ncbi:hypothetical protein ACLOJK_029508 [Asimina triloba]
MSVGYFGINELDLGEMDSRRGIQERGNLGRKGRDAGFGSAYSPPEKSCITSSWPAFPTRNPRLIMILSLQKLSSITTLSHKVAPSFPSRPYLSLLYFQQKQSGIFVPNFPGTQASSQPIPLLTEAVGRPRI